MKKRLFMILLTLLICLTLLPTSVLAAPWFITFTSDLDAEYEVYEGGSLTLTVAAKIGNSANPVGWTYSYQWYKKVTMAIWFTEISGATGSSYSIPSASKMYSAGQYYCKVTATHTDSTTVSENSTTTTVRVVNAAAPPVIDSPLSEPPVVYLEKNAGLQENPPSVQAHSTDGGTLSYRWYGMTERNIEAGFNPIVGPGCMENTLLLQNYASAGVYYYKCEVKNTKGGTTATAWSPVFSVSVNPTADISYWSGETTASVDCDEDFLLSLAVTPHDSGLHSYSYEWFKQSDGSWVADGSDSGSYNVDTSAAGVFRFFCIVTIKSYGAQRTYETAPFTVTVTETPEIITPSEPQSGTDTQSPPRGTETPGTITPPEPPYHFPFIDVADSAWYRGDVEIAHKNGLINGISATAYAPDNNMTIAEAIKLAACMHQLYHDGSVTLTNGNPWYSTYVGYALANNIISGAYADYNAKITRREYVRIFHNALPVSEYAKKNTVAAGAIPDVAVSDPGASEIYTFYRAGILTGSDANGTFNPASNIKRSEVAAILTRMFDPDARRSIMLP